ncbi:MAG TPA: NTP transferase domain-containing protein [Gaiellales bacterium]|nr:NTP transferase domain-containing protein [Gaiellales bacterium]
MTFQGLVLAGGEGSRMRADGVADPKALVPVGGRPQAQLVLEALAAVGCETLTCAARDDAPGLVAALSTWRFAVPFRVVPCRTPTSLHTFVTGLEAAPPGPVLCSMVDTVMRREDWHALARQAAARLAEGAFVVLAVTSFVNDKSGLYVTRAATGDVVAFEQAPGAAPLVTGGVYALGPAVRPLAGEALRLGVSRMRGFLDWLVRQRQVRVATIEVPRIIDLDRATDVSLANAWLAAPEL